ncbi:MAG: GNAT family N-acetyltransferase [Armatimonadetes bacterium]|nr:GNAT family N-acetyltransferase [Armatimonadota bacterium]
MPLVRPFRPEDTDAVVDAVKTVYDRYGFAWDPEGYCADLFDVARSYPEPENRFWTAEHEGRAVGCVGLMTFGRIPGERGSATVVDGDPRVAGADCELVRLYVHPDAWGLKLGRTLTQTVIEEARARGCDTLEIWSDKKLAHAHALYEGMGAVRVGERICPGDPDQSPEWGFALPL